MMRHLAVSVAVAVLLIGCGSSSSSSSSTPTGVTGTILGQPFTAVDASSLTLSQGTCSFLGVNANATGLLLGFGSVSGLCSLVTEHQMCGIKANATIVTAVVVRANVAGGTASAVQPGTYTILTGTAMPVPDAQGNITAADAVVSKTDSSCNEPSNLPSVTSGTVTITGVGARTTGSVDLVLSDGGRVSGSFDAPTCTGFQTDVCTAIGNRTCPSGQACVP